MKEKRSIGCQTIFRESEVQTDPAPLGDIERDGDFQEIFELKEFSYRNGLPVTMHEIELIAKAREKRAFNDALPPLSDEVILLS
jgi:pregnane X receptor